MAAPSYSITEVEISEDGVFTIPEHIRTRYGIEDGMPITLLRRGNCIHILPFIPDDKLRELQALEGEEAEQMAQELIDTYRWEVVNP